MDAFLKQDDVDRAALIAHEVMLQEYVDNPLTLAACLVSCLKCVKKMAGPSGDIVQELEPGSDEKKKLLVYFLRKPYNDQHFDLKSVRQLCGKTIYFSSKYGKLSDENLAINLQV